MENFISDNRFSIDRIEGGAAVLESLSDMSRVEIASSELPEHAKEGDVLEMTRDGEFLIDRKETERIRSENYELFKSLTRDAD